MVLCIWNVNYYFKDFAKEFCISKTVLWETDTGSYFLNFHNLKAPN